MLPIGCETAALAAPVAFEAMIVAGPVSRDAGDGSVPLTTWQVTEMIETIVTPASRIGPKSKPMGSYSTVVSIGGVRSLPCDIQSLRKALMILVLTVAVAVRTRAI